MRRVRLFLSRLGRATRTYTASGPPLGVLSLAAYVRRRFDLDIRVFDQRLEDCLPETVVAEAIAFAPDIVGLSATTHAAGVLARVAHDLRGALPNALIVLGGAHVSAVSEKALETISADAVVVGEGERAFEQIVEARLGGGDLSGIPGLIWRGADGAIVVNPGVTPLVEDLDSLPFPAHDLIDMRRYWKRPGSAGLPPRPYATLLTSRGCTHQCIWCHKVFGKRFRAQSAERVVEEIQDYQRRYGIEELEILDDSFNAVPARVLAFSEIVRKRGVRVRIAFCNGLRADILAQDTIDALVDAGMYYSGFALDSASPRIQEYTRKRLNIDKFLAVVEMAARRRVFIHGFVMLGFPTETEADMERSIEVSCGSRFHVASFSTVIPYPGTEVYALAMQRSPEKIESLRYEDQDYSGIVVNFSDVPDKVFFRLQREAWRRFYLDPRRMARVLRDYPHPLHLMRYAPIFTRRLVKGLI